MLMANCWFRCVRRKGMMMVYYWYRCGRKKGKMLMGECADSTHISFLCLPGRG